MHNYYHYIFALQIYANVYIDKKQEEKGEENNRHQYYALVVEYE